MSEVPHRRGWELGELVGNRQSVYHRDSNVGLWTYGANVAERIAEAQQRIDEVYRQQWERYVDLIEAGDAHGPNVIAVPPPV